MWKQTLICTALLSASQLMCPAGAQDRVTAAVPVPPNLAYPVGSEITFQWTYSCHNNQHCVFGCGGSQNGVTDLTIYLGTVPVGNNQKAPALFYYYSTPTIQRNNGFRIVSGPYASFSCDVNGMTLDYSGPPKEIPSTKEGR
jgi:hypothetical protein